MKKSIISKPNTSYNLYGKQCIYTSTSWTFPKCKEYMRNWHFYKLNNLSRQDEGIYLCKPHHIWLLHCFLVMIPPLLISHISDVSPCNLEVPDYFIADLSILELSRSPERRPSQFTRRINMNVFFSLLASNWIPVLSLTSWIFPWEIEELPKLKFSLWGKHLYI